MRIMLEAKEPKPRPLPKLTPEGDKRPMGRQAGAQLKPMDMNLFLADHNLLNMFVDHPWIAEVRLYSNTLLRDTLAKTTRKGSDPSKWVIELSSKVLDNTVAAQRKVFVQAICDHIGHKIFGKYGATKAFPLLVERYNGKPRPIKYVDKGETVVIEPDKILVKH